MEIYAPLSPFFNQSAQSDKKIDSANFLGNTPIHPIIIMPVSWITLRSQNIPKHIYVQQSMDVTNTKMAHLSFIWHQSIAYTTSSPLLVIIRHTAPPRLWPAQNGVTVRSLALPARTKTSTYQMNNEPEWSYEVHMMWENTASWISAGWASFLSAVDGDHEIWSSYFSHAICTVKCNFSLQVVDAEIIYMCKYTHMWFFHNMGTAAQCCQTCHSHLSTSVADRTCQLPSA